MVKPSEQNEQRPDPSQIDTGSEFHRWYWLKKELIAICKQMGLPSSGSKFELRDRIMYALDNEGKLLPSMKKKHTSSFNWSKEELHPDTVITDNISFGAEPPKLYEDPHWSPFFISYRLYEVGQGESW